MEEVKFERLHPGLPVCDVRGEEIGTLAHVHGHEPPRESAEAEDPTVTFAPVGEKVLEVKTGFLGLGKHLYVPAHAIEMVTDDEVIVGRPREELQAEEWRTRPPDLIRLT